MMRATDLAHQFVRQIATPGDWVVDATVGNGHDTLLLANLVGASGRVFGFDVQDAALAATAQRARGLDQVELIRSGHEDMGNFLPPDARGRLSVVMFNLGYLPGADKSIATQADTTLAGIAQAMAHLRVQGRITVVLYPGHPGGEEEAAAVHSYAGQLPQSYSATHFARLNTLRPAPELLVIERLS